MADGKIDGSSLLCVNCINWIPIEKQVSGYCYKRPIANLIDGTPVFGKTDADNPCDDFDKRETKKDINWPQHIYGTASIIVPILLWVATHSGRIFGNFADVDDLTSNYQYHTGIDDQIKIAEAQNHYPGLRFGPLTAQLLGLSGLHTFNGLDDVGALSLEYCFGDLFEEINLPAEMLRGLQKAFSKHDTTEGKSPRHDKDRQRVYPDIESWKVINTVLGSLGRKTLSEWYPVFSEMEEYLKSTRGDDDSLRLMRA